MTQASAGVTLAVTGLSPKRAAATVGPATVTDIFDGARGVTLTLQMEHGPFPCRGESYTDATTFIFVPHHFRIPENERVDTIVHFHGHSTTAREAMERHELREQLYDSRQNAILVMPQGPVNASDSSGGKLDRESGLLDFLGEVRRTLQLSEVTSALGAAAIPAAARIGATALSAHSGGYRVAARCVELGGFNVTEVYLFDALYGGIETFLDWIVATADQANSRERHKIVSFFAGSTRVARNNRHLMNGLRDSGVRYAHEEPGDLITRRQFTRSRAVFIESELSHSGMTHDHNNLRDCLYASCFRRQLATDWFEDVESERAVDVRAP
jgi:hypothetical protein